MAQRSSEPLKAILKAIKEQADHALKQLQRRRSLGMEIVFYKRAIPDDLQHPVYDSPVLSVSLPPNYRGTKQDALEYARKLFKEQMVARM